MPSVESKYIISAQNSTDAAFSAVEKNLGSISGALKSTKNAIAGLIGIGGFGALITSSASAGKEIEIFTQQLNISAQTMSRWSFAGEQVGFTSEKMADIFKDVSEKIGDAFINQGGEAKEALDNLGISASSLVGMKPDQQLLAIASALDQIETRSGQIQVMEALANDASRLIPLLENDAALLKEFSDQSDNMGRTLNDVEANALSRFDKAMRDIGTTAKILGADIAIELHEPLEMFADFLKEDLMPIIRGIGTAFNIVGSTLAAGAAQITSIFQGEFDRALIIGQLWMEDMKKLFEEFSGENNPLVIDITEGFQDDDAHVAMREYYLQRKAIIDANEHDIANVKREFAKRNRKWQEKQDMEALNQLQWVTNQKLSLEQQRTQGTIYLMQALGQKSKGFAIAAFAAEKVIAIQRILMQTRVAAAAALTPPPIGLGPVHGQGLAASIRASGNTSAILTGAASIVEGFNRFGGEGSVSAPNASIGGGASGGDIGEDLSPSDSTPYQESSEIHIHLNVSDQVSEEIVVRGLPLAVGKDRVVVQTADGSIKDFQVIP